MKAPKLPFTKLLPELACFLPMAVLWACLLTTGAKLEKHNAQLEALHTAPDQPGINCANLESEEAPIILLYDDNLHLHPHNPALPPKS